jgi:hypothetical protein
MKTNFLHQKFHLNSFIMIIRNFSLSKCLGLVDFITLRKRVKILFKNSLDPLLQLFLSHSLLYCNLFLVPLSYIFSRFFFLLFFIDSISPLSYTCFFEERCEGYIERKDSTSFGKVLEMLQSKIIISYLTLFLVSLMCNFEILLYYF